MKISILCSSQSHPIWGALESWRNSNSSTHDIQIVNEAKDLMGGQLLFLVACSEIVTEATRRKFSKSLVIHASDLPEGRGWSPLVWSILSGKENLVMTLLEADDRVDTGDIWHKLSFSIEKWLTFDEITKVVNEKQIELMNWAVNNFDNATPTPQEFVLPVTMKRRSPMDSELDPNKSLADQFDLLRICDPLRYPARFSFRGRNFKLILLPLEGDSVED